MTTSQATPLAGGAPPRFVAPHPRPSLPPEPGRFVAAACVVGVLAGAWLPFHSIGLGAAVIGLAILAIAAWRPLDRWRRFCVVAAGALTLTPVFRDADWVVTPALMGAVTLVAVGLPGGRSWTELARTSVAWIGGLIPATASIMLATQRAAARRRLSTLGPIARGLLLATPLVLIFGALFASADAAFSAFVDDLSRLDRLFPAGAEVRAMLAFAVAVSALALRVATRRHTPSADADGQRGDATTAPQPLLTRIEWSIALGALVALFALFVALQLRVLFGDDAYVLRAAGLTYAEYAREGFGQLTAVAALTLAVLAGVAARGPASDRVIRLLCAALCLLTLVVVASAWHRLALYETAFGATRLRFSTHLALLWFAGTFVAILVAGAARRGHHMPRVVVALSACLMIGFVAGDPDRQIAKTNVDRALRTGELDDQYLYGLSADAAPELMRLGPSLRACPMSWLISTDRSVAAFNRSRDLANALAASDPPTQFCAQHQQAPPGP